MEYIEAKRIVESDYTDVEEKDVPMFAMNLMLRDELQGINSKLDRIREDNIDFEKNK